MTNAIKVLLQMTSRQVCLCNLYRVYIALFLIRKTSVYGHGGKKYYFMHSLYKLYISEPAD
jgi:hypothetical protein